MSDGIALKIIEQWSHGYPEGYRPVQRFRPFKPHIWFEAGKWHCVIWTNWVDKVGTCLSPVTAYMMWIQVNGQHA